MTLDSLPDLDTSGLCLVKTLPTALTCWPYRNMALRDGARTSARTSSVAKGGRPRYTAGPRRRGKPKHSHRGHPVPGPGNVAAKRCASEKRLSRDSLPLRFCGFGFKSPPRLLHREIRRLAALCAHG